MELLKRLTEVYSPSGNEDGIRDIITKEIERFADEALGSSGLWVSCALGAGSWELPRDKNLPDSCQESYPTHLNIDPVTKRGSEVGVACFLSSFTNNFAAKNKLCFPSQEPW